jgi:membrane-bound lytic murein transglycosylase A
MIDIKNWLLNNPEKALPYMNQNKRYVFHQLIGATGPLGAMGLPLSAGRSLAVDPSFIPLGALMWLDTTAPDGQKIQKLINAQDVGGAIKGAIRGDYYWGSGGDEVLALAGKMNSKGSYYIFIPKSGE